MSLPLIALAAGGTGGHMFPAQSLAQEMQRRGYDILLVTDARGARFTEGFPATATLQISAATPSIGGVVAKVAAAFSLAGGLIAAMREFRKRRPVAVVGFGGYPSVPAMQAAALMNIPYGLHEQNGVLGRSNRLMSARARFLAHGFPVLERVPAKAQGKLHEVGNPVRDQVKALVNAPYTPPLPEGEIRLLIFGGSQGASLFSQVPPLSIAALPQELRARLVVTHQVRDAEAAKVKEIYQAAGVKAEIAPFFADLPERIARAHFVIARAGASTVTEIALIGRPSLLVPLAIAMDDHQSGNARALSEPGAAVVLREEEFTSETLAQALQSRFSDSAILGQMAAQTRGAMKADAAQQLAVLTEQIMVA